MSKSLARGDSTARSLKDHAISKRIEMIARGVRLQGSRLLDIGCGNGLYTIKMTQVGAQGVGIDVEQDRVQQAQSFGVRHEADNVQFLVASGSRLPFRGSSFDLVTMIEVLEHVERDRDALRECWRVLRPHGRLVLFVPNKLWLFETHGMRLGRRELDFGFIPFVSWAPEFVRRRIQRARIYSSAGLLTLLREEGYKARVIDYMWPPLDKEIGPLRMRVLRLALRQVASRLERSPLRMFGLSIFLVAQKVGE
ncbi:MAG: class I SAM-dependent methyltransferase [Dehalococcoidia bacterium]|nr:class I SAM-dependent methyltransferase [Dehalococcoidia bacterium]